MGQVSRRSAHAAGSEGSQSRTEQALLRIREVILSGTLVPGERISELYVAEYTGISRTPIRTALQRLEQEGLIEVIPSGGFAVKSFSMREVFDAIEIRGTLEGLAARLATERNPSAVRLEPLRECLRELDEVVGCRLGTQDGFAAYVAGNERLHALIIDLAESPALARQIDCAVALPFASASAFVMAQARMPESQETLRIAQDQHRCVVEAISNREGTRAEAIMQEHSRLAARNMRMALRSEAAFGEVPGGTLIRTEK